MALLPTYDELLRARFDEKKKQAQSLVDAVIGEGTGAYGALEILIPELFALSEHFQEPLSFSVDAQEVARKKRVMEALGPIVEASAR